MRLLDDDLSSDPLRRRLRRLSREQVLEEAVEFLQTFFRECGGDRAAAEGRLRDVRRSIRKTGFYEHTPDELAFGARVAWRNHARCIGRLHWKSLEVLDCRATTQPDEIAAHMMSHMRLAAGQGRVRSVISIFSPVEGARLPAHIENAQIAQYAGYMNGSGESVGDPQNIEFTRIACRMGWRAPSAPGPFDLLPLILRDRAGRRRLYEIPEGVVDEVEIEHPTARDFNALGLRWYTVPCVSNMILSIGGIEYPCSPFNGHYMATEIANRNLVDSFRYDLLPVIAKALGLTAEDPLWRDAALLELNRAVLHSFNKRRVSIVDHHTASEQFVDFMAHESASGRVLSADWAWIVPPQAPAACPVFHREMNDAKDVPNFYKSRAIDGMNLYSMRLSEDRTAFQRRADWARRRWRDWRRSRAA